MNKMYKEAQQVRRGKQKKVNSQVRSALRGLMPKNAKLTFDLTDNQNNHIDINRNAKIKSIAIVSDLLDSFGLPSKAKLEYHGMLKNATNKNGDIEDGIVKIGAIISTLMAHKIAVDIPVIVKNKKLIEPAVIDVTFLITVELEVL